MATPAERLMLAFELHDTGVKIYRARQRRENPEATAEEIDALVGQWLRQRPGAEYGDADGRRILDHPLLESDVSSSD